ncbi:MAG: MBL fold metallo-hydrolase [Phycisphaerales bacterium]|nr:MBL fold metallo-hydrolase [Phycisphaerales bacterium]
MPRLCRGLAREGAGFGAPVLTVLKTHHHGDHTGGNGVLHPSRKLVSHAKAAERIAGQLAQYAGAAKGGPKQVDTSRPGADVVLAEAQAAAEAAPAWTADLFVPDVKIDSWPHEMKVGEIRVVLYHFGPGHTDNDVVVHLPDLNVVHTGDVCFHGLHPFFDTRRRDLQGLAVVGRQDHRPLRRPHRRYPRPRRNHRPRWPRRAGHLPRPDLGPRLRRDPSGKDQGRDQSHALGLHGRPRLRADQGAGNRGRLRRSQPRRLALPTPSPAPRRCSISRGWRPDTRTTNTLPAPQRSAPP